MLRPAQVAGQFHINYVWRNGLEVSERFAHVVGRTAHTVTEFPLKVICKYIIYNMNRVYTRAFNVTTHKITSARVVGMVLSSGANEIVVFRYEFGKSIKI